MYKIAVLGDRDSVMGFKALGLETFFAEDAEQARHTLHRLAKPAGGAQSDYAIIYITEQLAELLSADIRPPSPRRSSSSPARPGPWAWGPGPCRTPWSGPSARISGKAFLYSFFSGREYRLSGTSRTGGVRTAGSKREHF